MLDRLAGLEVFVRVAQAGNFSAAARTLGLSQTMITRHIAAIEERLQTKLFHRSTRRMTLTEEGQRYLTSAEQLLTHWREAEADAASESEPHGTLRLNVPLAFGIREIAPLLAEYRRQFPKVAIDLGMTDRVVDLVEEGWDLAVRIGRLRDSSLLSRKLAEVRAVVAGSPDYLARAGRPRTLAELSGHVCLGYTLPTSAAGEHWLFGRDGDIRVPIRGTMRANNGDALRLAALAGEGLVNQPTFIVGEDIKAGRLVPLEFEQPYPAPLGVHAVYPQGPHVPSKVRSFVEFLHARWSDGPPWESGLSF